MTTRPPVDDSVLDRLEALERASDERRAELRELAEQLPAQVSRRAVVAAAIDDLVHAPDKLDILVRGLRKLGRAPRSLWRRLTT